MHDLTIQPPRRYSSPLIGRLLLTFIMSITLTGTASSSDTIEKCIVAQRVIYTDQRCPDDSQVVPFTPLIDPPGDPKAAQQQYDAQLKALRVLQQKHEAEQRQSAVDAKTADKIQHDIAAQTRRCRKLEDKRNVAVRHLNTLKAMASQKALEQGKDRLRQAQETWEQQCSPTK